MTRFSSAVSIAISGVVGLIEQVFAIGLFGGVELAGLVEFEGVLQIHCGGSRARNRARPAIMP